MINLPRIDPNHSAPPQRSGSVLIVDDDPINLIVAKNVLERQGYSVSTARGGDEALGRLITLRPNVIIMDFMMPDMNGPDVLRELRKLPAHARTPVLFLTSSADAGHIRQGFKAGAQDFITRPVNARVLGARVSAAIDLYDAQQNAIEAERQQEALMADLYEARTVQQAQIPAVPTRWDGWRGTGAVVPSGSIGGDLFAFSHQEGSASTLALVDVCGHGVAAALIASRVTADLRSTLVNRSPAEAMAVLNEHLQAATSGKYAAIAVVETSETEARVVNAGLPPVLQIRDGKVIAQVEASGVPPGMLPDQAYDEVILEIQVGDRLVLMSDGLTEPFGHADDVASSANAMGLVDDGWDEYWEPKSTTKHILERLRGGQPDDATLILLERYEEPRDEKDGIVHSRTFDAAPSVIRAAVSWAIEQLPKTIDRSMIDLGLTEAITNAVMHGALGVASGSRGRGSDDYLRQIDRAATGGLTLDVHELPDQSKVVVRWEGEACPFDRREPPSDLNPLQSSGRGLFIIHNVFDEVNWADSGCEMELVCRHVNSESDAAGSAGKRD